MPKVEKVTPAVKLGEGPHWDVKTETLYFVDLVGNTIHSYKPNEDKFKSATILDSEFKPSLIIPIEGEQNKFVVSNKNRLYTIEWDGNSKSVPDPKLLIECESNENRTRLNDGKADPAGRLWTGTMGLEVPGQPGEFEKEMGALYSVINDKVVKHLDKIHLSNGLGWSKDNKQFYYNDSLKYRVDVFDYDITTGKISNQKELFDFKKHVIPGCPDGLTVDADGKILVAVFGGGLVLRIDPETGELIQKIQIPAAQVTSLAFGGSNFDELYVTTANIYPTEDSQRLYPQAGSVFKLTELGFKGNPATNVKL